MTVQPAYSYREGDRKAVVDGLRELANFLVLASSLPVPRYPSLMLNVVADTDADRRAAVTRVARLLKVSVQEDEGTIRAVRNFGPIRFQCWASTLAGDAEWNARRSYDGSVQP
jgi:hypothetical protein